MRVRELLLSRGDERRLVWYFYKSGSRLDTRYWRHQAGIAWRKLTNPTAADVLVRVHTNLRGGDSDRARRLLADYLASIMPFLRAHLP